MLLGICMPYFLTVTTLDIPGQTYLSIATRDKLALWTAAIKLVGLNSIRAFPHFLGAFIVAESIEVDSDDKITNWLKSSIVCLIIPPVYYMIGKLHHIRYDLGVPAFALIFLLILIGKQDYNYVSLWKKNMLIVTFLTALQFLDIMPVLGRLPIGRGEMSTDIKLVARFLDMESELDATALLFFTLFMFIGILLFLLIRDENNLKAMNELKDQHERMVMDTKLRVLENRTYLEMRHLVHDLKSPLTSAQALVGVVRMSSEKDRREQESLYLERVEASIEKMSGMISEILYENHTSRVTTEEMLDSVLAQISVSEYSSLVETENKAPGCCFTVNKIRFSRAVVNLLENSFYALTSMEGGRISLVVDTVTTGGVRWLRFSIKDNGKGIDEKTLNLIWEGGFSTRSSHGLGLSFVKKIVDDAGGRIQVESKVDEGTEIELLMPLDPEKGETDGTEEA